MRIKLQHAQRAHTDELVGEPGFYFELQADGNHETLATSEVYNTKEAAIDAMRLIIDTGGADWLVVDET